jgi:membrane protease YdiL (CAAX protease family)
VYLQIPDQNETAPPVRRSTGIFIGPFGLRAGWRWLLFLLLFAAFASELSVAARALGAPIKGDASLLIGGCISAVSVLLPTWIMSRIERRPFWRFGLRPVNYTRNLLIGIAAGLISLSVLIAVLLAVHGLRFGGVGLHGSQPILWALFWLATFVLVAITEELVTRGYPLFALSQGIGFWAAAVLMSVLFGVGHLGNGGEDYIGICAAVLIGLVLAYSLKWTGSLWWAIGFHLAWDWGETFLYGVPDSGRVAGHHLLSAGAVGPAWLSGGSVGPEGSVLVLPIILLLGLSVRFTLRQTPIAELERPLRQNQ